MFLATQSPSRLRILMQLVRARNWRGCRERTEGSTGRIAARATQDWSSTPNCHSFQNLSFHQEAGPKILVVCAVSESSREGNLDADTSAEQPGPEQTLETSALSLTLGQRNIAKGSESCGDAQSPHVPLEEHTKQVWRILDRRRGCICTSSARTCKWFLLPPLFFSTDLPMEVLVPRRKQQKRLTVFAQGHWIQLLEEAPSLQPQLLFPQLVGGEILGMAFKAQQPRRKGRCRRVSGQAGKRWRTRCEPRPTATRPAGHREPLEGDLLRRVPESPVELDSEQRLQNNLTWKLGSGQ